MATSEPPPGSLPSANLQHTFHTARLTLTLIDPSSPEDVTLLLSCFTSPIAFRDMGDFGLRRPSDITSLLAGYYILPHHSLNISYGRQPAFWIIHLGADPDKPLGPRIGFVALTSEPTTPELEPHMGWQLLPEYMGKGYATEAAVRMRDYWTGVIGVVPIRATIRPGNERSLKVAERVGMERGEINGEGKVVMWWRGGDFVGLEKEEKSV